MARGAAIYFFAWSICSPAACGSRPALDAFVNGQSAATISLVSGVGSVALSGCAAYDYFAEVNVGGQALHLLVDCGSTTLAVAVPACVNCGQTERYALSTSGRRVGEAIRAQYFDLSGWSGITYRDQVAIGSQAVLASPPVAVTFAGITEQTNFFRTIDVCEPNQIVAFDGILGLGPDAQLIGSSSSLLSALAASNKLAADVFALHTCDVGGTLSVGGYHAAETAGAANFTPLLATGSAQNIANAYAVSVVQMRLGGIDFGLAASSLGPAAVDNGTNAIVLPSKAYAAFLRLLENNQAYLNNFSPGYMEGGAGQCQTPAGGLTRAQLVAALPKLTYTFPSSDGSTFDVELPATSSYLVAGTAIDRPGQPTIYCPAVRNGDTFALIGNVGLRQHVVVFDRANSRLGFAPEAGCQPRNVSFFDGT